MPHLLVVTDWQDSGYKRFNPTALDRVNREVNGPLFIYAEKDIGRCAKRSWIGSSNFSSTWNFEKAVELMPALAEAGIKRIINGPMIFSPDLPFVLMSRPEWK